jgi:hypothetical protein
MRAAGQKMLIAFFRRITDKRKELLHIMLLPLRGHLQDHPGKSRLADQLVDQLDYIFLGQEINYGGLDRLDREFRIVLAGGNLTRSFRAENTAPLRPPKSSGAPVGGCR